MDNNSIYLTILDKITVDINENVYLSDISKIYCKNDNISNALNKLVVYKAPAKEDWDIIDLKEITKIILEQFPDRVLKFHGATKVLVEIKTQENINKFFEFTKTTFVCILLFFGAGMGITYFHQDVNMTLTMQQIYYSFTGERGTNIYLITIPYSIGLGAGMITFFHRLMSKSMRRRKVPGPMDVSLYSYDKEEEEYILGQLDGNEKE